LQSCESLGRLAEAHLVCKQQFASGDAELPKRLQLERPELDQKLAREVREARVELHSAQDALRGGRFR
jgi:hypothetical protein